MENLIGTRMNQLMHSQCITQQDLAYKAGTTPVTISRYLSGQRIPTALMMKRIADILHAPTDYFLDENYSGMLERTHKNWLETILDLNDELARNKEFGGKSLDPQDIFLQSIARCLADIADVVCDYSRKEGQ